MNSEKKDIYKKIMLESINKDYFATFLGLEFIVASDTYCRARIPFKDELKNPYRSTHGGVLYSACDIVAGVMGCLSGHFVTTVNGSLNYLLPATAKEYIYIESKVVRKGKHLIVTDVEVMSDNGDLVDKGVFTFFVTETPIDELGEKL